MNQVQLMLRVILTGTLLSCLGEWPAIAQPAAQNPILNRAEVYRFQNAVTLLRGSAAPRPVRNGDSVEQRDRVRTAQASIAELLFNDRTLARIDQNTTFTFRVGLRRLALAQAGARPRSLDANSSIMDETIFVLERGTVLVVNPPGSVGTQVEACDPVNVETQVEICDVRINIAASELPLDANPSTAASPGQSDKPSSDIPSLTRSSAVLVIRQGNVTQVFALTNGDITVSPPQGGDRIPLRGGQMVTVSQGRFGAVQEFDLESFYQSPLGVRLAAGLGPGQRSSVAAGAPSGVAAGASGGVAAGAPSGVAAGASGGVATEASEIAQQTLSAVRPNTLVAIRQQAPRLFVDRSLGRAVIDFYGQSDTFHQVDAYSQPDTIRQVVLDGSYIRGAGGTFQFVPDNGGPTIPIEIDVDNGTVQINGQTGIDSSGGLSGNSAAGTVILPDGRAIRGEVFNIDGSFEVGPPEVPPIGTTFRGRLTTTVDRAPDR